MKPDGGLYSATRQTLIQYIKGYKQTPTLNQLHADQRPHTGLAGQGYY